MTKTEQNKVKELLSWDPDSGDPHLTDWEIDFLDSLSTKCWERPLSWKQEEVLERIWQKIFG